MNLAAHALSTGLATVVVIATAAAGQEGGYASADRQAAVAHMAKLSGPYEYVYGTTRVSDYAVYAMRHAHEFGTTQEQLAEVAVAQRHAATLHPNSVNGWRGEITVEDVINSPMIADPLHLLDCCVVNQGAGAMVMTRAGDARGLGRHDPVLFLGYGEGHSHIDPNSMASIVESPAATHAAATAFRSADISPSDIDVAGISDHFHDRRRARRGGCWLLRSGRRRLLRRKRGYGTERASPHQHLGGTSVFQPRGHVRRVHRDRGR